MNQKRLSTKPLRGPIVLLAGVAAFAAMFMAGSSVCLADGESAERILIPESSFRSSPKDTSAALDEENPAGARRFNFDAFRGRVLSLWFKRKALLQQNMTDAAAEQTQAIEQLCQEVGVTRLDEIASAFVREGHGYLDEGNFEKARGAFEEALTFGGDLPEAHFGKATAYMRQGGAWGPASAELAAGGKALVHNESLSSAAAGNLLIIFVLAVAATVVLFSVAMMIRYHTLLRHELSEWLVAHFPGRFSQEGLLLAGWTLVLLPLLTWVFALWTPAFWIAATFRFQRMKERTASAALLALLVCAPPVLRGAEFLFGLAADPSARLMLASTSSSYDPEQIVMLEQKAAANPRDPAYRFLLGGMYARGRYDQEAIAQYQQVIDIDPRSHRAINNLGNIYLRNGRPEEALKLYKNALSLKPNFLPGYYNSYLARKEMLQLREAEEALKEGQAISSRDMAALIEDSRHRTAGDPVEAVFTREEVFRRILGEDRGQSGIASAFSSIPALTAALFLIAALMLGAAFGKQRALRCIKCGDPYCHRCKIGQQSPDYCTQCQHMVIARDGLAPSVRKDKQAQTERFKAMQARTGRWASAFCPGMGRMLDGRTATGAILAGAWSAAWLGLLLRPHLLQIPSSGASHPLFLITALLALAAVSLWLIGNAGAVRPGRQRAGSWQWR